MNSDRKQFEIPGEVPLSMSTPVIRRIHIAGDSIASQKYAAAYPETGWGMALPW